MSVLPQDETVHVDWLDRPAVAVTTLARKLTHKYVGTFDHLDDWEDIGQAAILSRSVMETDAEDICEPWVETMLIRVDLDTPETPVVDIRAALHSSFTNAGCHHEHDCCGCRSFRAEAQHLKDADWMVTITSSRNY